jgi:hypothetical protein
MILIIILEKSKGEVIIFYLFIFCVLTINQKKEVIESNTEFFFYKLWLQHESCTYIYINQKETKQKKGGPNQNPSRKSKQGESISIMIIRLDSFTGQMTMPNETIQRQA